MNVRLTSHSERLLKLQLLHGGFRSPEDVVERALELLAEKASPTETGSKNSAAHALAEILDRKGVTIGGIRIKNLVHEGH